MQVTVFPPSERLAPLVRGFTVVETGGEATRTLLPERGLILGLRWRGQASLVESERTRRMADASLTGFMGTTRRMRTAAASAVVLVRFRETGAARLFDLPLHELFNDSVALDQLLPRAELERVTDRLAAARDHAHRVRIVDAYLAGRVRRDEPDPLVAAAVRAIDAARGSVRIAALARELAISQDPLEKRFRRTVGTTPKQFASLVRLQRVIERAGRPAVSWSRLAVDAGYFDQSHLIREFRAATGESPARFFRGDDHC